MRNSVRKVWFGWCHVAGSTACTKGPSVANDASSRDAHLGPLALRATPSCGRHARDSGVPVQGRPIREEYLIVDGGELAGTPPTEKSCCIQPKP